MITAAVLTVSDSVTEGTREDRSGPAVAEELRVRGFEVVSTGIVSDVQDLIEESLKALCFMAQLVVTTGGTGISEKDVTPEATRAVCSKLHRRHCGEDARRRLEGHAHRNSEPRRMWSVRAVADSQSAG